MALGLHYTKFLKTPLQRIDNKLYTAYTSKTACPPVGDVK